MQMVPGRRNSRVGLNSIQNLLGRQMERRSSFNGERASGSWMLTEAILGKSQPVKASARSGHLTDKRLRFQNNPQPFLVSTQSTLTVAMRKESLPRLVAFSHRCHGHRMGRGLRSRANLQA